MLGRDVRREHRGADERPAQLPSRQEVALGPGLPAHDHQTDDENRGEVGGDDEPVERVQVHGAGHPLRIAARVASTLSRAATATAAGGVAAHPAGGRRRRQGRRRRGSAAGSGRSGRRRASAGRAAPSTTPASRGRRIAPATGRGSGVEVGTAHHRRERRRQPLVLGVGEDRRSGGGQPRPGGVEQSRLVGGREARVPRQELQQVGRVGGGVDPAERGSRPRRSRSPRRYASAASSSFRYPASSSAGRQSRGRRRPRGRAPRRTGAGRTSVPLPPIPRRRFSDSRATSSRRSAGFSRSSGRRSSPRRRSRRRRATPCPASRGRTRPRSRDRRPTRPAGTVQSLASSSQNGFPRLSARAAGPGRGGGDDDHQPRQGQDRGARQSRLWHLPFSV